MFPSIGRIVIVVGEAVARNGGDLAPAIITRVHSPELINATTFPDADAPMRVTSIRLFEDEDAARAYIAPFERAVAAFWPARV